MILVDKIYGTFEVKGVMEELINSSTVQRLKGIHQGGASFLVNPNWNVTRYEHSIGAMLLVKMLGGSIEEQIAALLHDISHTAFSHVVDFVLGNKEEDYHEKVYDEVVIKSDIPAILKKHGYSDENILKDDSKWTILEKPAPALCADRVDYTLRDMFNYGAITKEEIDRFLKSIDVYNGEIIIKSIDIAKWFVELYYKEVLDYFMHPLNVYGYDRLSKALKLALQKGYLNMDDFLKNDEDVLSIIKTCNDMDINNYLNELNSNMNVVEDKDNYEIHQKQKLRIIDPSILIKDSIMKASELSDEIEGINIKSREKALEGIYIRKVK